MVIKKNTMIIGLGNCGCKITKLFADMGYSTMFANGSEQDLKVLGNMKGIYKLDGYDGFGRCPYIICRYLHSLTDFP